MCYLDFMLDIRLSAGFELIYSSILGKSDTTWCHMQSRKNRSCVKFKDLNCSEFSIEAVCDCVVEGH